MSNRNLLLFLITLISSSVCKGEENLPDKIIGTPEVTNCAFSKDMANEKPFRLNNVFWMSARWSNYTVQMKYPKLVTKYDWYYHIVKEVEKNGKIINEQVDTKNWLRADGVSLKIPAYTLTPGVYLIKPEAKLKKNLRKKEQELLKNAFLPETTCYHVVTGLPPVVIISGGTYRMVPSSNEILLSGEESADINKLVDINKNLQYYWRCEQQQQPPNFCIEMPVSTNSKFTIPARFVQEGDMFKITLEIETLDGFKGAAQQEIEIIQNAASLQIDCEKNCPPVSDKSNVNFDTFLRVKCVKNCFGVNDADYEWTVKSESVDVNFKFDYEKNTQFGRFSNKFFIYKNVLEPGNYLIIVTFRLESSRQGKSEIVIKFDKPPRVKNCKINPTKGWSFQTNFQLNCEQEIATERNFYEFLARNTADPSQEDLLLDGYSPEIFSLPFTLPPSNDRKFIVKITPDTGGSSIELQLTINVQSLLSNHKNPEFVLNLFRQTYNGSRSSITYLLSQHDDQQKQMAFRMFNSLVDELVISKIKNEELDEFIQSLKYKVVTDMLNTSVESFNEIIQLGNSISKLMAHHESSKSDPLLAKFSSTICKKMITKHFELMKKEHFPLNYGEKAAKVSNTLTQCLETNTNPNYDVISPQAHQFTTEIPFFDGPIVTENYANYLDFEDNYYKNLEYESTYNIINATLMSAKVMAMTTAAGEKFVESFGNTTGTIVAKDQGNVLIKTKIQSQGVALVASPDFANSDHLFDILMSTWSTDILWWNPAQKQVATDIANIEFWHSTCKERITAFKEPVKIYFDVKSDSKLKKNLIQVEFMVPEGYGTMSGKTLNRYIKVRRVTLPQKQVLHVEFSNLLKFDIFDVVITKFKFPTIEDFENSTVISLDTNSVVSIINDHEYDIWCYIAILANANASKESVVVPFSLSFYVAYCIRWIPSKNIWEPTCQQGDAGSPSVISCECKHFSVIAGFQENIESLPIKILTAELELKIQSSSIIFVSLTVIFILFCLLASLSVIKKKADVYFLADNIRNDRFAYLVIVKTGRALNSGTTSSVIIKLNGNKKSSAPHVLNYPDPKLKMLQHFSTDMFLLTTHQHLGDITKMELWFHCVGKSPEWYCREIIIYDLQEKIEWLFIVKKRLSIIKEETYLNLTPSKVNLKKKCNFKFITRHHTWYFWHQENRYKYFEKLTIVFSKILSIFGLVLIIHGLPEFNPTDSLDHQQYEVDGFLIIAASVGSFSVFVIHLVIVLCFRFEEVQVPKITAQQLSPIFTITAWALLIILIVISISILLLCGFWVPYNKSFIWLTSSALGIAVDVSIYEYLFLFLQYFFRKLEIHTFEKKIIDIWAATEAQRQFLYSQFGDTILRPYLQKLYKPMKTSKIRQKSINLQRRRRIIEELEDLIMFGIYVVILYIVILSNKDSLIVYGKTEMEQMLTGLHTRTISFTDITSAEEVYHYINATLIAVIQPNLWYNKFIVSEPGLMKDMTNKYIGVVRFRQQRMKSNLCTAAEPMNFLMISCRPEFSLYFRETKTFGYSWGNFSPYFQFDRLRSIWRYSNEKKTGTFGTVGEFAFYSGGGYIAYLGRTLYNSYANFRKMVQKIWVDHNTRSVFIEFMTYNANYNVFNAVKLLFEQSATGYAYTTVEVSTVRMLFVENEFERMTYLFFFFFVVWVGMMSFKQSLGIIRKFKTFYKDMWLITDVVIVLMSLVCIALYTVRIKWVGKYLDTLEKVKHNEFLNYFYLFYLEDFLTVFGAVLVCIATIRLWKFLRFGTMFRILERTLVIASIPFFSFAASFFLILLGFAMTLVLLCGNNFEKIDTIVKAARIAMTMGIKSSDAELRRFTSSKIAILYLVLYGIIVKVSMYIFITIIIISYSDAQIEFSSEDDSYNIKHYVLEQFKYVPRYFKYKYTRLKAGQKLDSKIQPKSNRFFYCNSFSMGHKKMETITFITRHIIKNFDRSSIEELCNFRLISEVCRQFLRTIQIEHEVEFFYKGRTKSKRIRLIDEQRILKIARIVNFLLSDIRDSEDINVIKKNQSSLNKISFELKMLLDKVRRVEILLESVVY